MQRGIGLQVSNLITKPTGVISRSKTSRQCQAFSTEREREKIAARLEPKFIISLVASMAGRDYARVQ